MIIHNASFIISREREEEFLQWFRIAMLTYCSFGDPDDPKHPQLSVLREAGGVESFAEDATTVAFQVEFDDMQSAREWSREVFSRLAVEFERRFAPEAMVFTSLFEQISIR